MALALTLPGCGSSARDLTTSDAQMPRTTPDGLVAVGVPGAVTPEEGSAVPLGLSPRQLVRRLGQPAVPLGRTDAHYRCMFYNLSGQPPKVQLQYCFRGHRLRLLSTYVDE